MFETVVGCQLSVFVPVAFSDNQQLTTDNFLLFPTTDNRQLTTDNRLMQNAQWRILILHCAFVIADYYVALHGDKGGFGVRVDADFQIAEQVDGAHLDLFGGAGCLRGDGERAGAV